MKRQRFTPVLIAAMLLLAGACSYRHQAMDRGWDFAARHFAATPTMRVPRDNPMTPERIALGKALFHDARLSVDGSRSCASCHAQARGYGDGVARARGRSGAPLKRHTPSLWNVGHARALFWDGRAATLEEQALAPIRHREEMGRETGAAVAGIRDDPAYRLAFAAAFPERPAVDDANLARALAAYQRTLVSGTAPFDRWRDGDQAAISASAQRGFAVFAGPGNCASCHRGALFTDNVYHDIGLPGDDPGRGGVTRGWWGNRAFRTPPLREIGRTAPYMHDGSVATLAAVVDHYSDRVVERGRVRRVRLSDGDKRDLVAFLQTLDSEPAK